MISTKNTKLKTWTHTASSFPWITPETKRQNIWPFFIYSFFCGRPINHELWSSSIYFFYLHTTIWPKYMILSHVFFILRTTIWLKYMVLFHLFFLLCAITRLNIRCLTDLSRLFAHDHSTEVCVVFDLFFL